MATKTPKSQPAPEAATAPTKPAQLRLVVDPAESLPFESTQSRWRLDDETKAIGREGLARAREILNSASPSHIQPAA